MDSSIGSVKTVVNSTIGSVVTLDNTEVPLLPGQWQKFAERNNILFGSLHDFSYVQASYALIEGGRLRSLVGFLTTADALSRNTVHLSV